MWVNENWQIEKQKKNIGLETDATLRGISKWRYLAVPGSAIFSSGGG